MYIVMRFHANDSLTAIHCDISDARVVNDGWCFRWKNVIGIFCFVSLSEWHYFSHVQLSGADLEFWKGDTGTPSIAKARCQRYDVLKQNQDFAYFQPKMKGT